MSTIRNVRGKLNAKRSVLGKGQRTKMNLIIKDYTLYQRVFTCKIISYKMVPQKTLFIMGIFSILLGLQ